MAHSNSTLHFVVIFLSCSLLFSSSSSQPQSESEPQSHGSPRRTSSSKPNLLVLPVHHDPATGLPWAYVHKRTPLKPVPVFVDLNGNHMWLNCDRHYSSSTYQAPFCHSTQCSRANSHTCHTCVTSSRPGCHNNTCALMSNNPVTEQTAMGELAQDVLAIHSAQKGPKLGPMVTVPQFLFSCAPSTLGQKGLPQNAQGVAGLGHSPISLPSQLESHFGLQRQFTMCLSRDPASNGVILFGNGQNNPRNNLSMLPYTSYTPLTVNQQGEYYVQVTAIRVNKHSVFPITPSSVSGVGFGGTLISTAYPYTVLHHTIFEALRQVYAGQMPKQAQVTAVGPFGLCFDSKKVKAAPSVELVMEGRPEVVWRVSGENLMVEAGQGVSCLGFVDGGMHPRAAIAIGARQLEENVVVFDLARSRLGFSSWLSSVGKKCGDLFDSSNRD